MSTICTPLRLEDIDEARGAFGGFIGPQRLLAQVWNTAPWIFATTEACESTAAVGTDRPLYARAQGSMGWRDILVHAHAMTAVEEPSEEQWLDYFVLCLAAHFGTCGTYVPTDVDTKIRGHLWFRLRSMALLEAALDVAEQIACWDIRSVTARTLTYPEFGVISGHDGERLSVLGAGLLRCVAADHTDGIERMATAISDELTREAAVFDMVSKDPSRSIETSLVSGNLTHNAGDLDQGFSCDEGKRHGANFKQKWGRLAHERFGRFGGAFRRASAVNKLVMAPEAHRHYPLRKMALLRHDPRWLRPGGPFLDDWGEALARNDAWTFEQKGEVLDGLLNADKRVDGQRGYVRALIGFGKGSRGGLDLAHWKGVLGTASRKHLKGADLRKRLAVTRASFEGTIAKQVRTALGRLLRAYLTNRPPRGYFRPPRGDHSSVG